MPYTTKQNLQNEKKSIKKTVTNDNTQTHALPPLQYIQEGNHRQFASTETVCKFLISWLVLNYIRCFEPTSWIG